MDNEELLKVIDDAVKQNLTGLELRSNQLTQIPPEIYKLTSLQSLNLRNNKLRQMLKVYFLISSASKLPRNMTL